MKYKREEFNEESMFSWTIILGLAFSSGISWNLLPKLMDVIPHDVIGFIILIFAFIVIVVLSFIIIGVALILVQEVVFYKNAKHNKRVSYLENIQDYVKECRRK